MGCAFLGVLEAVAGAQTPRLGRIGAAFALEGGIVEARRVDAELDGLEQEMRRTSGDDPPKPAWRSRYRELQLRCARVKQAAIARAIEAYNIDVRSVPFGVHYSVHGGMREREGATYLDQDGTIRVEIGDEAFRSAAQLGSTIGHEVEVHVNRQIVKQVFYPQSDEQGTLIQEVEAYDYELANKDRYGLSHDEVKLLKRRRAIHYQRLQWENRKRVDASIYTKW
jgi:hypothetical protein